MFTGRNADDLENLRNAEIRAPGFSGEYAIDTWEDEGGGPDRPFDPRDLVLATLADNAGIQQCRLVGKPSALSRAERRWRPGDRISSRRQR